MGPIRLQVEHMSLVDVVKDATALADTHARHGRVDVTVAIPDEESGAGSRQFPHPSRGSVHDLSYNTFEAMNSSGYGPHRGDRLPEGEGTIARRTPSRRAIGPGRRHRAIGPGPAA